jgi:HAD superfamily hydrolase (TIGR01549 family)
MINTLLFDFFGTLTDYTPGQYFKLGRKKAYTYLLDNGFTITYDSFGNIFDKTYFEFDKKARETLIEFNMYDYVRSFFEDKLKTHVDKEMLYTFTKLYLDEWNEDIHYFPEIKKFIESLAKEYKLGIVSNTHFSKLISYHLDKMEIRPYFSGIFTSVEFGKRKPSPDIFKNAVLKMNSQQQETVFIGDSYYDDYLGAKQASLRPILIDKDNKYPDVLERANSLFEITNLI